jgi:ATP/maltotriose-dependent transcriptional regulator MalT
MCVWRGDWVEAEKELVIATHELLSSRPALSGEGQARLGELRRRQGRFGEAADLFDQAGHHPVALVGRMALHLDRGEPRKAMDLADRYLRQLPAHNRTERAAGLEPLVRACVASGAIGRATAASRDLDAISREAGVPHLLAAASQARGHVAAAVGDDASAQRSFEDAVDLFQQSGAPFETARARLDLARALGRLGQTSTARDEVRRAVRSLDGVHAAFELAQARDLDTELKNAIVAPAPAPSPRTGLTPREQEIVRLIAGGLNNDRIGQRLFISGHTVHRHVANIFAKLNVRTRSAVVARAAKAGII